MSRLTVKVVVEIRDGADIGPAISETVFEHVDHLNPGNPRYRAAEVEHAIASGGAELVRKVAALYGEIRDEIPVRETNMPHLFDRPLTREDVK